MGDGGMIHEGEGFDGEGEFDQDGIDEVNEDGMEQNSDAYE